jgi:hypothetical protein
MYINETYLPYVLLTDFQLHVCDVVELVQLAQDESNGIFLWLSVFVFHNTWDIFI